MKKLSGEKVYTILHNITPPFIFMAVKRSSFYEKMKNWAKNALPKEYTPSWNTIKSGSLKGKKLFVDPNGHWQKEMLDGNYDNFFFDYVDKINLKDRVIFDVGAHIGYSSLYFATRVGPQGKVFAFEPNIFNVQIMKKILNENADLQNRIEIIDRAVSDKNGKENLVFSPNVDSGISSGSFIKSADTIWQKNVYKDVLGFQEVNVSTISLDSFVEKEHPTTAPSIIKIDVEGAEYLVVKGAKEIIKKYQPTLLIEVHSIFNMFKVSQELTTLGYKTNILKEEKDGRCFIVGECL